MLAKLGQGSLNIFHLETEMFDANLTAATLSLGPTFKNGEVDVAIREKNAVQSETDLFETEDLLVKGGCLFWICRPDSNVLNPGHSNLLCAIFDLPRLASKFARNLGPQSWFLYQHS